MPLYIDSEMFARRTYNQHIYNRKTTICYLNIIALFSQFIHQIATGHLLNVVTAKFHINTLFDAELVIRFLTIPTDFMIAIQKISKKTVFLTVYYNNLDIKQKTG